MNLLPSLLERRRLIVASALLLAMTGLFSWMTMPREEDPQFPERDALVLVYFAGADAETVERLVLEPVEEHLAEVEEVQQVFATARAGIAIVRVELHENIYATDAAWDEVEDALQRAQADFPATGVSRPILDHDLIAQEAVVLAVRGSSDPLILAEAAEQAKRRLLPLDSVRRVKLIADPKEQITIEYDDATARRLGVDPRSLGLQLASRSTILPGGLIHLGAKTATLRPETEFRSVEEIAATPVLLPSGASVPLGELARVRRGPAEPASESMRWNGEPVVGLGIIPKDNIDRVVFGEEVRRELAELNASLAPLAFEEVLFQPDQVAYRLDDLSRSLLLGILIVAAVLFVAMGPRLGLLVALIVPLVTFAAIAIFAAGGGVLHQISIAALVIALGMLVDNAIVVAENIQWRIDRGEPPRRASVKSIGELAVPLGTATGTTLAAFVPMLISDGPTADFTRSIPVLILLTLTVSYFFAVLVTPVLAEIFLRRRKHHSNEREARLAAPIARLAVSRPGWVVLAAHLLLLLSAFAALQIDRQFFPAADRNMVIVDLEMPEGTHLERTDEVSRQVEAALQAHPDIVSVAGFVGRSAPHFYYNLQSKPQSPHRAQIAAEVTSIDTVERVMRWTREWVRRELPEVVVVARRLEQGPPLEAPIEVKLYGHDLSDLEEAADKVLAEVRSISGTRDVRHDLGLGVPTVAFEIDDAVAGRYGLARSDVAQVLLGRTLGLEIGQYRVGDDPVPILVRSNEGENLPVTDLATLDIAAAGGDPVPLEQLARFAVEWRPAAIHHHKRERVVKVLAQLDEGTTSYSVLSQLQPRLEALQMPRGISLAYGGEAEESGAANAAILRTMPLGVLLLLFFLLAEFNSFRRVGIVLLTVPLSAIGVVPGLLLSGQPFGFMSMLGVVALVGIVVNNAIVLLDVIEARRAEGASVDEALSEAIKRRIRPILLTMATTVAGLSPLALSSTSLWPPLAWAMISGLVASTVLTLIVIPALYKLLFGHQPTHLQAEARTLRARLRLRPKRVIEAAMIVALLVTAGRATAEPLALTLDEAISRAVVRPGVRAAERRAAAADFAATAERRAVILPVVAVSGDLVRRDRDFAFDTPLGEFNLGERSSDSLTLSLVQPLLDPAKLFYGVPAARSEAATASFEATRIRQRLIAEAAESYLEVLAIEAALRSTEAFIESLEARLSETEERVAAGRILEADALKVRLDLESAQLDRVRLSEARRLAMLELGRTIGHEGEVEPSFSGRYDHQRTPVLADLAAAAAQRPDLQALASRQKALELRADAVQAQRLPRLEARASLVRSSGDPFLPEELFESSIGLVWTPFAAGTLAPRKASLDAQSEAVAADLEELRRLIRVELRDALRQLATARAAIGVRESGVTLASETLRVESERHRAGRSTINDLLDAETELRRQRTERDLAQLDVLRAWIRLSLAVGAKDIDLPA